MGYQLRCGDCLAVMADLPAESVDVVVTSPPQRMGGVDPAYDERRHEAEYLDWMTEVGRALHRVLRPDGSVFLNVAGSTSQPFLPFELIVRLRALFTLQNHIVWVKSIAVDEQFGDVRPVPGERFLHRNHEHVFHLTRHGDVRLDRLAVGVPVAEGARRAGHELRCRGDTWFIPYPLAASTPCRPGAVPVDLPRWCIRLHGKPGAVVLDPFAGAGTTLVAAAVEGCSGIGIEIDPEAVAEANRRLAALPFSPLAASP